MLIGREVEVLASRDKSMLKIKGLVIDETKNLLVLRTSLEREVKVPKSIVTLRIENKKGEPLELEGAKLVGTPSDRIKG
ncbi:MAG TPA: ribonuclease P protein subunit [Nitrososphaerales archaeon]|nr:ribonuclease P protein subunit [Nitrososphaerales archaeon]